MRRRSMACLLMSALVSTAAFAQPDETWNFDLSTSGEDVFYTSPTAVDPTADQFDLTYEITTIEVTVLGGVVVDVTDELPPGFDSGFLTEDAPLPVTIFNETIVYPADGPVGFAGTIQLGLDAAGFGVVSITDVTLGQVEVDNPLFPIGPPTIMVDIEEVRVAGIVTATAVDLPVGDINRDRIVDSADLNLLLSNWDCSPNCGSKDLSGDGQVGAQDLNLLLSNWNAVAR